MQARLLEARRAPATAGRTGERPAPGRILAALGLALLCSSLGTVAEAQYTAPGTSLPSAGIPPREELEEAWTEARWDVGPLRLAPWLGIRDASLVQTTSDLDGETEEDFTLTVGAGLRGYAKTGGKLFWALHALPEYVWWQDLEDKRRLNGRYGAGVFGYFNRLTFEASHRRLEVQRFFSNEVQELTTTQEDVSRLALDLRILRRLSIFGDATRYQLRNEEEERPLFALLERDEDVLDLGLRLRTPRGWTFAVAWRDRDVDFESMARDLSNTGDAVLVQVDFQGARWRSRFDLAFNSFEPTPGSSFAPFDETTGNLEVTGELSSRTGFLLYTRRDLSYAVDFDYSHFLSERTGVRTELTTRYGGVGLFYEGGEDDYAAIAPAAPPRLDDVAAYGGSLTIQLGKPVALTLQVVRTEYDSNLDVFDREVTSTGFAVELGALVERLRLGRPGAVW